MIFGRASVKGSYFGTQSTTPILRTDSTIIHLTPNQTYRVMFRYRIVTAASNTFDVLFISEKAFAAGKFLPEVRISGKDGDTGTGTLERTLGPYDDYWINWTIKGTGAIIIDDIQLVDVATGNVIASEGAESSVAVEDRRLRQIPGSPR